MISANHKLSGLVTIEAIINCIPYTNNGVSTSKASIDNNLDILSSMHTRSTDELLKIAKSFSTRILISFNNNSINIKDAPHFDLPINNFILYGVSICNSKYKITLIGDTETYYYVNMRKFKHATHLINNKYRSSRKYDMYKYYRSSIK